MKYNATMRAYWKDIADTVRRMTTPHQLDCVKTLAEDSDSRLLLDWFKDNFGKLKVSKCGEGYDFECTPQNLKILYDHKINNSGDDFLTLTWAQLVAFIQGNKNFVFDKSEESEEEPEPTDILPTTISDKAEEIAVSFNYAVLSVELGEYLKHKEEQLKNEYMNFTANCGRIFAEAQERLANNKNGLFEKWIESMGFSKPTVYRMIDVHKFISSQIETISEQEMFNNLPKMLQYDIASPSAPPELVEQVMSGDITTHKDYIALKKQLEETNKRADKAEDEVERAKIHSKTQADSFDRVANQSEKNYQKYLDEYHKNQDLEKRIRELETEVKDLESRPVDVAVQSDSDAERKFNETLRNLNLDFEKFRDEADKELADMRNQRNAALDRAEAAEAELNDTAADERKMVLIRISLDDLAELIKAAPYKFKNILEKAQVIR